jgi:hypothetical protein
MSEEKQTPEMASTADEYLKIFTEHLAKLGTLTTQRQDIEREIEKVTQMLSACYNMLSEDQQRTWSDTFTLAIEFQKREEMGLTEAIRNILQSNPRQWFTPIQIRDRLQELGFDFSGYTSNPLSSVHSVLKRFKPEEVRTSDGIEGRRYQGIIMRFPRLVDAVRRARLRKAFVGRSDRALGGIGGLDPAGKEGEK